MSSPLHPCRGSSLPVCPWQVRSHARNHRCCVLSLRTSLRHSPPSSPLPLLLQGTFSTSPYWGCFLVVIVGCMQTKYVLVSDELFANPCTRIHRKTTSMASSTHWVAFAKGARRISEGNLARRCDLDGMNSRGKAVEEKVVMRNDLRRR